MSRLESGLERLRLWDQALCIRFNYAVRIAPVCRALRIVSRLGDGVFWYSLMFALVAADGARGARPGCAHGRDGPRVHPALQVAEVEDLAPSAVRCRERRARRSRSA